MNLSDPPTGARAEHPLAMELFDRVVSAQKFFDKGIQTLSVAYGEGYVRFVDEHVRFIFERGIDPGVEMAKAVEAYTRYSMEYLWLQERLEASEEARYECASFDDGRRDVYDNPAVMEGYYLDGLYLSLVLWPNHYRMLRYFLDQFVPWLPAKGRILELPVGAGSYLAYALMEKPYLSGLGVDISRSAIAYAQALMRFRGLGRAQIEFGEAHKPLVWEDGAFEAVISGELLEHLDDPTSFLRECVRVTRPGGFLFVTTAIYAAAIDHVFMFEDVESVNAMLQACGADLASCLAIPVRPGDALRRRIPINYAAVLHKPAR